MKMVTLRVTYEGSTNQHTDDKSTLLLKDESRIITEPLKL